MSKKTIIITTLASIIGVIVIAIVFTLSSGYVKSKRLGGVTAITATASTTTFTLTTSSQRLMSTSTRRIAATIQPTNCTAGAVYLNLASPDAIATANNGMVVLASTTQSFDDYNSNLIVPSGSVQGINSQGTCTVLVTEFRTNF